MGCGMKRWLAINRKQWLASGLLTGLALCLLSGCQPVFLTRDAFEDAHTPLLPKSIEEDHSPITDPITGMMPVPATVTTPDRPPRYLTLQEAIAIALENGHVSGRAGTGRGLVDDSFLQFTNPGSMNTQTERLRVLALNPAFANAAMEAAASRYDAVLAMTSSWNTTDAVQTGIFNNQSGQGANVGMGILKPLSSGGIASIGLTTTYNNLVSPPSGAFNVLNPLYTTRFHVGFEQPLLKDFGSINQLLQRVPSPTGQSIPGIGNFFTALNARQNALSSFVDRGSEGILISRLRFDQSRAEFERNVHALLVQAEVAYWNLYNKYGQLYSAEENLRVMHKTWQESYNLVKAGTAKPEDYYQVLGQYHEFRGERIRSLQEALEAERVLRGILGLPGEDGTRLVPITPPNMAEMKPDWDTSLQEALTTRPEIVLARDNLRYHQYLLSIQQNNLSPDLRAFMRYEPVGFGNTLQGDDTFIDGTGTERTTNAFRSLRRGDFADWQVGLNLIVPIGFRLEYAAIRGARLQLTQSYYLLRDQEEKTARVLQNHYQEMARWYKSIEAHRSERLGYLESLKTRDALIRAGKETPGKPAYLETQRRYAAALIKEYNAIAEYNNSIARFEWAKGATLRYNNVHISEGALPQCAQVRAVEYEKERSQSFVLLHRPDSLQQPGRHVVDKASDLPVIEVPEVKVETAPAPLPAPPAAPKLLPKVDEGNVPAKPTSLPRDPDPRWAPKPPNTEKHPEFKFAPTTPNRLPDQLEPAPKTLKPAAGPALQTSSAPASRIGTVTVEEPTPRFTQSASDNVESRERIIASTLTPPSSPNPVTVPNQQTLEYPRP
jgi:outer membrane protein TolC